MSGTQGTNRPALNTLETAMEEDSFAGLETGRADSIGYNGMFSRAFAGANNSTSKSAMDNALGNALGGTGSRIHKELTASMLALSGAINTKQNITMDNIFTVNAGVADAYKRAFDACEKAVAEIKRRREAEKMAKEPKKPRELEDLNDTSIALIRYKSSHKLKLNRQESSALKAANNYDKALAAFEKHKKEVDAKYAAPLVSLGGQMTLMASNRGFIPSATQAAFDRLRTGEKLPPGYTFEKMLGNVRMPVISNAASEMTEGGAVNEVYRVEISEKELFVKPGKLHVDPNTLDVIHSAMGLQLVDVGILSQKEYDARLHAQARADGSSIGDVRVSETAFRDQGMYVLSKMLDMDAITPSRLGVDNKSGYVSVMDGAKGVQAEKYILAFPDTMEETLQKQRQVAAAYMAEELPPHRITSAQIIDASDPSFQVASLKLSVLDYIGGHFDRHVGNFFVSKDENGRYRMFGIDNDSAFPTKDAQAAVPELENVVRVITPEVKQQIMDLDADRVVNALKGIVDRTASGQSSLDGVRDRIIKLQEHVKDMLPVEEANLNAQTARDMLGRRMRGFGSPIMEISSVTERTFDRATTTDLQAARNKKQADAEKAAAEAAAHPKTGKSNDITGETFMKAGTGLKTSGSDKQKSAAEAAAHPKITKSAPTAKSSAKSGF